MDMFNKISSKIYSQVTNHVSTTMSQLSVVLPGNPVTREFDASNHIASAGPGLVWKIYSGTKCSTKQEASIFVFEKRQLERYNKNDRDIVLESLRRGIVQLTKIRHPQILTVQHPLEESRESLAFATEPVFASLANIFGNTYNMPQPTNLSDFKLFDVEIKYGLLQLGEGLTFLHNDVKLIHGNISPESVIINKSGVWKIFGFDFCVHNKNHPNIPAEYPFEDFNLTLPSICRPNLDFLAPEKILEQKQGLSSDIFSMGMLCFSVYSQGNKPLNPVGENIKEFRNRSQYLKNVSEGKLMCLPEELRRFVKSMLSIDSEQRSDANQFVKIPFFDDLGVKTLQYLDSLLQWDNIQKSQFYKSLPAALPNLPQRVKVQRVLHCLTRDLNQPVMVPFILPSVIDIAKGCTKEEYCNHVLVHLKPLMKIMDPIQVILIFLQNMELLLKMTPADSIHQDVLPMLYRGLDCDIPKIHELCLSVLPTFAGLLDHSNVKNHLLPRIKKLCLNTNSLSVRVNCLLCIGGLLEHLDKWLVMDEILPFMPQITSREPAVLMGILGIYKIAMTHKKLGISKEIMATRILPFLIPLCIENSLSLTQYNSLVALVKDMFNAVETDHRTKLTQLNAVKDQQRVLVNSMPEPSIESKTQDLNQTFSDLGLGNFVPAKKIEQINTASVVQPLNSIISSPTTPSVTQAQYFDVSSPLSSQSVNNQAKSMNFNKVIKSSTSTNFDMSFPKRQDPFGMKSIPTNPVTNSNFMSNSNSTSMNLNNNPQSFGAFNKSNNWSGLDNLLPVSNSKVPMNQMSTTPLLLPSNVGNNNGLKISNNNNRNGVALSKDEIMDFLS